MKELNQEAQMKTPVVAAMAIVALIVGGAVGYIAAPSKPGETVTVTRTAPTVTHITTTTQTVTRTADTGVPFSMEVIPERIKGESIPGQKLVFLVVVEEEEGGIVTGKAVGISATATGSAVTVDPQSMTPGQVAEVAVIPDESSVGGNVTVTIRGQRDGVIRTKTVTFGVAEGEDALGPTAAAMRDRFVPWLAASHPELGVTNETKWIGSIVSPIWLVVSHYLFFSDDWEMHVSWHVMIAPHDWARIDLRRRFTEARPSYAFEISSVSSDEEPHAIDPPESVWR